MKLATGPTACQSSPSSSKRGASGEADRGQRDDASPAMPPSAWPADGERGPAVHGLALVVARRVRLLEALGSPGRPVPLLAVGCVSHVERCSEIAKPIESAASAIASSMPVEAAVDAGRRAASMPGRVRVARAGGGLGALVRVAGRRRRPRPRRRARAGRSSPARRAGVELGREADQVAQLAHRLEVARAPRAARGRARRGSRRRAASGRARRPRAAAARRSGAGSPRGSPRRAARTVPGASAARGPAAASAPERRRRVALADVGRDRPPRR